MSTKYKNEEQVKKALKISSFRELSKDKVIEFVSMIPDMDKDVALAIIGQFGNFKEMSISMVQSFKEMSNKAMDSNDKSQMKVAEAYNKIIDQLGVMLQKDELTFEEKQWCINKEVEIADKLAAKDTENKQFLGNVLKAAGGTFALVLGVTLIALGGKGNVKVK